jgi:hypothetical protein
VREARLPGPPRNAFGHVSDRPWTGVGGGRAKRGPEPCGTSLVSPMGFVRGGLLRGPPSVVYGQGARPDTACPLRAW